MSPPDSSVYAGYLFELGLVGEVERDTMLDMEKQMKYYASTGQWYSAWQVCKLKWIEFLVPILKFFFSFPGMEQ